MKTGNETVLSDKTDDFIDRYLRSIPRLRQSSGNASGNYRLPDLGKDKAVKRGKVKLSAGLGSPYHQHVVVISYHYKMAKGGIVKLHSHLRYLERPSAGESVSGERLFDASGPVENGHAVVQSWRDDRHHFRTIISPAKGDELDMQKFVRDYMKELEKATGTRLQWVATIHEKADAAHPSNRHAHVILRGICDDGTDLVMKRDFIMHEMRRLAREIASEQIGILSQREVDQYNARKAERERTGEQNYHSGYRPVKKAKEMSHD